MTGQAARAGARGPAWGARWLVPILIAITALSAGCRLPDLAPFVIRVPLHGGREFAWAMPGDQAPPRIRDPAQERAAAQVRALLMRLRDARVGKRAARARLARASGEDRQRLGDAVSAHQAPGSGPGATLIASVHGPGRSRSSKAPAARPTQRPGHAGGHGSSRSGRPPPGAHQGTWGYWRTYPLPPGVDRAACVAMERELAAAYPWLRRLRNGKDIIALYALRMAWQRERELAHATMQALPDPERTIVSREKRARTRKRAPWKKRVHRALRTLRALPNRTHVYPAELCEPGFLHPPRDLDKVAREVMRLELKEHHGDVILDAGSRRGGSLPRVRVYLDGAPLRMQRDGLHAEAFFGTTAVPLLEVQEAYYDALIRVAEIELGLYLREHGWARAMLVAERFEAMISAQVLARLDRAQGGGMPEAQIIEDMRRERMDRAGAIRARAAAAMVPLTVLAGMFAIEGVSDLFLAAFPETMATRLVEGVVALRRAGKAARRLEQMPQLTHLQDLLDDQQVRFLRGVRTLDAGQRRSLLAIANKLAPPPEQLRQFERLKRSERLKPPKHPDVIIALMEGATKGHADLRWIADKLEQGHFDAEFVRNFTRYDARPTWRQLEMLLNNEIAPATRASLVSKLAGFRGEEAAAKLVEDEWFRKDYLNEVAPEDLVISRGDGSLDIVAQRRDSSGAVFAEVKNWSVSSWRSGRDKVKEQLRLHNRRIELLLAEQAIVPPHKAIHKLLMVEENGWMQLPETVRSEIKREIESLGGWKIHIMSGRVVEDTRQFIDRLRK